jgi:uncharacterized protein YgbK (DUF1537 family)
MGEDAHVTIKVFDPRMSNLLISYYGDDFTGSTDAMESLALCGVRTVLFTDPPTSAQLARHQGIQAFGVAGLTRAMTPDQMEETLRPAFATLRDSGAPIVHYKVCSTFDSAPHVGSIGRVIDVGMDVFKSQVIPIAVGAPALGRYCVFGNLFARCGAGTEPVRLDRHPSMSRHPTTPMDEADLRLHLAKQTSKRIGLFDITQVTAPPSEARRAFRRLLDPAAGGPEVVFIDLLHESQLAMVGDLIRAAMEPGKPLLVVGSSGIEMALCAAWQVNGILPPAAQANPFASKPVGSVGPITVAAGSCSPVTAGQIEWALSHGFAEVVVDTAALFDESGQDPTTKAIESAVAHRLAGRSVVIHTGGSFGKRVPGSGETIGHALGLILRRVLESAPTRRVLIAGGDTSGRIARALGIEAVEMIGELTRGSPLCRASAPGSAADGVEITFKGGQIGGVDFFGFVECGA